MQQINFIGRPERNEGATMIFIIKKKTEEKTFNFSQNAKKVSYKMKTQKIIIFLNDLSN